MSGIVPKSSRLLFGYIAPEFINLYTEDNKILGIDDTCFFMFTNLTDIHRPMIGIGVIRDDYYTNDINKAYYIEVLGVFEESETLDRYFDQASFETYSATAHNKRSSVSVFKKQYLNIEKEKFFQKHLIKVESFFVRTNLKDLNYLRQKYVTVITEDLKTQLKEANSLINSNTMTVTKYSDFYRNE